MLSELIRASPLTYMTSSNKAQAVHITLRRAHPRDQMPSSRSPSNFLLHYFVVFIVAIFVAIAMSIGFLDVKIKISLYT